MTNPKRRYDTPIRDERAARTRDRILAAGAELVHGFATWDWKELTFRAVADRAGVGERTVYRHFPTERHLHDAVLQRLNEEAGIDYGDLRLADFAETAERVFGTLASYAAPLTGDLPLDESLVATDATRRQSVQDAVDAALPDWPQGHRLTAAALLDVLWHLPSYERLVRDWQLDRDDAAAALRWLIDLAVQSFRDGTRPPGSTRG
jgi:AcrR family transcriptional regulator